LSYLVTGTDTGVGKTLVSCAMLHALSARGSRVAGFKPVAAGCDPDGRNEDAVLLSAASSVALTYAEVNPCCLEQPVAPHIAAAESGVRIELPDLLHAYHNLAGKVDLVVVEGAGGFLVPLNDRQTFADLAVELQLSVVLVVGMRLGCLNHALLTAEAITARGLRLAGWVANVLDADMPALQENIETLRKRVAAPLLGVIPYLTSPDAEKVHLDIGMLKGEASA
jgi:dethiobiotin synthetase